MNKSTEALSKDFLQQLLNGNQSMCKSISEQYLLINPSIKDLYEEIFKTALYEVGRLWEINKITVADEHLATAITEGILNELYENFDLPDNNQKKVVLTCAQNELHQVGIKMVADVFEMHGWESDFVGTDIPLPDLIQHIKIKFTSENVTFYGNRKAITRVARHLNSLR